ncbi:MAG: methyltransferase [Acidimicrobiales bacterium]|jgi:L-histidine N-alpha-methyltransferase|nr:methyltransferase [Acidimicrobiales bacterium]
MTPLLTVDVHVAPDARRTALEADVRAGLTAQPKTLPPIWFYDERGSQLFDEITRLPEYYLTRAERSILDRHAREIVDVSGADTLVELGSGTSEKTRLLLDAMAGRGRLRRFVPFDCSEEILRVAAKDITDAYGVEVGAVVGDFHRHLGEIPRHGRRLVAFLGSTIGNLTPVERRRFFTDLDVTMGHDDRLLLGTDLVKDRSRLVAAYDDAAGVTAEFNRNVLRVLNAELGAHFDPSAFDHVARWDEANRWMEMRLRSRHRQVVEIEQLAMHVAFETGEELHTEISAKFTHGQVEQELWDGGFVVERTWTDPAGDFLLTLARPYC